MVSVQGPTAYLSIQVSVSGIAGIPNDLCRPTFLIPLTLLHFQHYRCIWKCFNSVVISQESDLKSKTVSFFIQNRHFYLWCRLDRHLNWKVWNVTMRLPDLRGRSSECYFGHTSCDAGLPWEWEWARVKWLLGWRGFKISCSNEQCKKIFNL